MVFKQNSDTFDSFAWPEEFPTNPSSAPYENYGKIEKNDNNEDQLEQKLNSLCRRSFLKAETAEERNFLSRVCGVHEGEENKGNEILYDEESSSNHQTDDSLIKKLPRLSTVPSGYGYGQHLGKVYQIEDCHCLTDIYCCDWKAMMSTGATSPQQSSTTTITTTPCRSSAS